jgi:hypothetical protein
MKSFNVLARHMTKKLFIEILKVFKNKEKTKNILCPCTVDSDGIQKEKKKQNALPKSTFNGCHLKLGYLITFVKQNLHLLK